MINLVVADDEFLFRKGLIHLLKKNQNIFICLEATNCNELLNYLRNTGERPEMLLLDPDMAGMDGKSVYELIRLEFNAIKILLFAEDYSDMTIARFIRMGANACLSRGSEIEEIEKAIAVVSKDNYYFNEKTIRAIQQNFTSKKYKPHNMNTLTLREREVLQLICQELTNNEIAARLFISKRTAEGHRNSLLLKTGCKNTAGLVIYAVKNKVYELYQA